MPPGSAGVLDLEVAGWFAAWAGDDEIQSLSQSNFKIARGQLDQ